jgi:hypothetical protein
VYYLIQKEGFVVRVFLLFQSKGIDKKRLKQGFSWKNLNVLPNVYLLFLNISDFHSACRSVRQYAGPDGGLIPAAGRSRPAKAL